MLHRTVEQVFDAPVVKVFPQERSFERMVEQSVDKHVQQSVEEIVAELPFEVPKISSQDRILQ